MVAFFIIVFLVIFPVVIALTCGKNEEDVVEEQAQPPLSQLTPNNEIIMPLSDKELKEKFDYVYNQWQETNKKLIHWCTKVYCLYYTIDCEEEFFTFDEIWDSYLNEGGKNDTVMKEAIREVLLEIEDDGYLYYNDKKHTYSPTFCVM